MAERTASPGRPRWVNVAAIIGIVLVLLVVVVKLTVGDSHGPSRDLPSGATGEQTTPSGVTVDGTPSGGPGEHTPPVEHGG